MDLCALNYTAKISSWVLPEGNTVEIVRAALTGAAYAASLLFSLPTNGYVLWLMLRERQEKLASDFIHLNQIVAEILFCTSGIWYFLDYYLSLCFITKIFMFKSAMFLIFRPLAQSYICLEQYLATVHPVIFLRWKPLKYRVTCCCVSWLIVSMLSIVGAASNFNREFFLMIAAVYHFSSLLMMFCCISVLRALKRPGPGEGQRDRGNSLKKRAFKIILINLVNTTMSQVPLAVVTSLRGTIPDSLFHLISSVIIIVFVLTGFVPPILYLHKVGKLSRK